MARASNQIIRFRSSIKQLLSALEQAKEDATIIDYLGGAAFYRDELQKVDASGGAVYDLTPLQFTAAIDALAAIKTLLEANSQALGKALARMED